MFVQNFFELKSPTQHCSPLDQWGFDWITITQKSNQFMIKSTENIPRTITKIPSNNSPKEDSILQQLGSAASRKITLFKVCTFLNPNLHIFFGK